MNKYIIIIIASFIIGCSAIQKDKIEKRIDFQEDNSEAVCISQWLKLQFSKMILAQP